MMLARGLRTAIARTAAAAPTLAVQGFEGGRQYQSFSGHKAALALFAFGGVVTLGMQSVCNDDDNSYLAHMDHVFKYGTYFQQLATISKVKKENPDNLAMKHFDYDYFFSLTPEQKARFIKIVKSGFENPDSGMGAYAQNPNDYDEFRPFFEGVVREYHKIKGPVHHTTNWELSKLANSSVLPADGKLDLSKLGIPQASMRVRVGRNLKAFPLPGAMTKQDRINMENELIKGFKKLIDNPKFGGNYYSLTPGNEYSISDEEYKKLVKAHVMFKDMSADTYLASAGIASDWPYGRGCYVSADRQFIVWVGEEDHLRIMCMKTGNLLNEVFDRLKAGCGVVEQATGAFAHSSDFGYVTSCPTNLGTGMRASIHIKLPNLTRDGTDEKAKALLRPMGLSVRGLGGEHTPIGADGTVDISPSARFGIQEAEIICALYSGIAKVLAAEKAAA